LDKVLKLAPLDSSRHRGLRVMSTSFSTRSRNHSAEGDEVSLRTAKHWSPVLGFLLPN